ncbi:MAG: NAD(P)H-dependent oxidoreductase subunit E [Anaerolineales bacterium]
MNDLMAKYQKEIQKILAKYPPDQKRSAVMPLLFLAQRKEGFVRKQALSEISQILDLQETEVATLVGFYTLFHDHQAGTYRIQVCTDLCCALRGSEDFLAVLCEALEIKPGETTQDGLVTVEEVKCLAACDKAPMYQVQVKDGISYHENCSVDNTLGMIQEWREDSNGKEEGAI